MRSLLAIALLTGIAAAQAAVAHVDDPTSPGALGDRRLSLDEAIRVVNGTLPLSQLSAAELARIRGAGVPTGIEIDAAVTPTITLSQPLTPIDGPAVGVDLALRGVGGRPILDAGRQPLALRIRTNTIEVANLAIHGGQGAVDADASVHAMPNRRIHLTGLELDGQTGTSVRLSAAGTMAMTLATLDHTTFRDVATAIAIDDRAISGAVMTDVEHVVFERVARGVDLFTDATGSMTMCRLWRCRMPSGEQLARVRRSPTSDQRIMLMVVAGDFATTGDTIDAMGTPIVETAVHVHHSVIRPGRGRKAFLCGPQDARIDLHISEDVVYGDLDVAEGRLNRRLWAWNNVFRDGTFAVSNQGAPTSFRWNRFERCTIRALPTNSGTMRHASSEFSACTLDGQGFLGAIDLENCWMDAATTVNGNVVSNARAPSPWLATTSASTDTPVLGGAVDLTLDLPSGMLGVWELAISDPNVVLTQEPWRDYAFVHGPMLLVPGIYALQTTLHLRVPVDPHLIGAEIYCRPVTAPYLGQAHVPPFNLPRGAHLTIVR